MPCPSLVFMLVAMMVAQVSWAFTSSEQAQIVQKHNDYRSKVSPEASDMQKLTWDTALENTATTYAKKCIYAHNTERGKLGENIFLTTAVTLNPVDGVDNWYSEVKDYDFNANICAPGKMCGHYTQLVWASTTKFGCGSQFCETVQGNPNKKVILMVCDYSPAGNVEGNKPYTQGSPCTKCPAKSTCATNLCETTESSTSATIATSVAGGGGGAGGANAAPGMQPGSIALLTVFVFLWFCLN